MEATETVDAQAAAAPLVKRHHRIVRLTHWVNTVVLVGLIASGLQIYNAYTHFGPRGTSYPNPFDGQSLPAWARLGGWLAGGSTGTSRSPGRS